MRYLPFIVFGICLAISTFSTTTFFAIYHSQKEGMVASAIIWLTVGHLFGVSAVVLPIVLAIRQIGSR